MILLKTIRLEQEETVHGGVLVISCPKMGVYDCREIAFKVPKTDNEQWLSKFNFFLTNQIEGN